ncbi:hypothetical protein Unana1_05977 [Umbelopsis nana]
MYLKTFVQQVRFVSPRPAAALVARPYSMIPSTPHLASSTVSSSTSGHSDLHSMHSTGKEQEEVLSTVYVSADHHAADNNGSFTPSVNAVFDD